MSGPSEERLTGLREFLGELGIGLGGGEAPQPEDYQRVLKSVVRARRRFGDSDGAVALDEPGGLSGG